MEMSTTEISSKIKGTVKVTKSIAQEDPTMVNGLEEHQKVWALSY